MKLGLEQGREEGIEQGNLQIIRKLKEIGVPIEPMMNASGLTRDVIEKLE